MLLKIIFSFIGFLHVSAAVASGLLYAYQVHNDSWIAINGTTNVNSFTCTTNGEIPRGYLTAELLPGSNAVFFSDAKLNVRVHSFECRNRMMNKDLHEAMGGNNNPNISIKLKEIRPQQQTSRSGKNKIRAEFTITLNGVSRDEDIIVDFQQQDPFAMLVTGSKNLKMSDFGITPPSPAMGLVKVNNTINIEFHLLIEASMITQAR